MNIIDGKAFAEKIREKVKSQVKILKQNHNIVPGLAVVLVGEDPASKVYVKNKGIQTKRSGRVFECSRLNNGAHSQINPA